VADNCVGGHFDRRIQRGSVGTARTDFNVTSTSTAKAGETVSPHEEFQPVVIAPTYNNDATLLDILRRIRANGLRLIVVNDGSTDQTARILQEWEATLATPDIAVLTHRRNRGKAAALRTGFCEAIRRGFTHAVTIDTDGQLEPNEIHSLLDVARLEPISLVLGVRTEVSGEYPIARKGARRLSGLATWLECGIRVEDGQCGLRCYPLKLVEELTCFSTRFGFEEEIITRAAWAGCPIREVPVSCIYFGAEERVSHINPLKDVLRVLGMHSLLTLRRVLPWPNRKIVGAQSPLSRPAGSLLSRLFNWFSPRHFLRSIRSDRMSQLFIAGGFAVGAFAANLPLFGWQGVVGLFLAARLHLNPIPVVAMSLIGATPLGAMLHRFAIGTGHWLIRFAPLSEPIDVHSPATLASHGIEWLIGSMIVAFVSAWIVLPTALLLLRLVPRRGRMMTRLTR
jgi:uncharacterized protein (DUF2062 family)